MMLHSLVVVLVWLTVPSPSAGIRQHETATPSSGTLIIVATLAFEGRMRHIRHTATVVVIMNSPPLLHSGLAGIVPWKLLKSSPWVVCNGGSEAAGSIVPVLVVYGYIYTIPVGGDWLHCHLQLMSA